MTSSHSRRWPLMCTRNAAGCRSGDDRCSAMVASARIAVRRWSLLRRRRVCPLSARLGCDGVEATGAHEAECMPGVPCDLLLVWQGSEADERARQPCFIASWAHHCSACHGAQQESRRGIVSCWAGQRTAQQGGGRAAEKSLELATQNNACGLAIRCSHKPGHGGARKNQEACWRFEVVGGRGAVKAIQTPCFFSASPHHSV
jgi:hypothetical protein